jgi:hypothetical protein
VSKPVFSVKFDPEFERAMERFREQLWTALEAWSRDFGARMRRVIEQLEASGYVINDQARHKPEDPEW